MNEPSPIKSPDVLGSVSQEPEYRGASITGAEAEVGAGAGEGGQEPGVTPPVLPRVQRGHVGGARVHHQLVARVAGPGAALAPAHHAVHLAAHRHLHHAPQLVLGSAVKRSIGLTITEKAPTRAFS